MTEWYKVGKIVNTHGVKGEVRVISSTDFAEDRYAIGSELMIKHDDKGENIHVVVRHHRLHKNFDLLQFEDYHSINEVEPLKGATLYVSGEQLDELDEGEFYYHEIIGCKVFTESDEELGKIKEIIETGANDVWVIQRKGPGKDILIPYIEDVVKEIDVWNKVIRIHVMEGLVE
ncbi:ribosome maturation factor RimM [Halalkalibacter krulwichiae]|uniref:Ribosome maturation factor RimM n=1 Tax=Halalkalibacter krulwichiae TaxID=199441 RepID=A0A1X9MEE7_9BACI|nr:ribosome maturation factor RimM [Halalkalibacter krulwichiae]ARK31024.1 Ribosome maturation factor RimM [Halalkalibacter krulwichiae]